MSLENEKELAVFQAKLNRDTLDEHLSKCRAEIRDLHAELRELRSQIAGTVVEYERDRYASLELVLAFPSRYGAHPLCTVCNEFDCYGDHEKTRQW